MAATLCVHVRVQAVCGLFSSIEAEVAACKTWIERGPAPPPAPSAPPLRDRAALDAHLNRRLVDAERKASAHARSVKTLGRTAVHPSYRYRAWNPSAHLARHPSAV